MCVCLSTRRGTPATATREAAGTRAPHPHGPSASRCGPNIRGCSERELGERDEPDTLGLGDGTLGVAVGGTAAKQLSRGSGDAMGDGGSGSDGEHFDISVLHVGGVLFIFPARSR
jgi:hypothetical protein